MQKTAAVVHFNPLGLDVERLPIDRSVVLTFGAGVGSLLLKMRGDASEPYVSKTAEMPAGAGEAWPRETLSLYDQMAADYGLR